MSSDAGRARQLFLEAIEHHEPDEWSGFLVEACGSDVELRRRVEVLLKAHVSDESLLDVPAVASPATATRSVAEKVGTVIGPYKLLEQIGEGGFGNVYLAEQQEPIRRKVALKIIKLGMDTRAVIARFEAERQALALMDHLNIAKVLDAGATETGRPYFVMGLVRGLPITEYCDRHNLTARERLGLFMDVCQGIQHAHQKGIIHRDIKPSNILVTQQDGRPISKIIDFGVAKATQQRLTEKTLFTEHRQLVGTPEYMSPEQATFYESDVDSRSDIYSLGVLLYELLAGKTPFDAEALRKRGYDEICRVIRETEPPTPSQRFSKLGDAAITDISNHRHVEPATLRRLLRGDLDWIVMKCLEKDRTRRYETAHSLARDIERHLHDEPVQARPPSAGYQLTKYVRKHRGPVAAGCAVGATLILGLVMTSMGFLRAERERQSANSQLYVSDVNSAYHAWEEGNVNRVRDLLERHVPRPGDGDLRGFEWRYLWGQYQRTLKIPTVQHNTITGIAYSPDGSMLASASWDGTVKLWDAVTLAELRTLHHEKATRCIAFSSDGKMVASGSNNQMVYFWDAATGQQLAELSHSYPVTALAFSPDGKLLAAGCGGRIVGEIQLWNVATHAEVATLFGHAASVESLSFSPDGKILASGSRDRTLKLWDVESGAEVDTLRGQLSRVDAVAFSPGGETLASSGLGSTAKLWNMHTREIAAKFSESTSQITCLAFSPDGATLAVGADDSRFWLWDVASGSSTVHRTGHSSGVKSLAFSPDGACLATGGEDGTVQIAEVPQIAEPTSLRRTSLQGHSDWFAHLAVCPSDNSLLAIASGEISEPMTGELILWDVAKREARVLIGEEGGPVESVAFSSDGAWLAAGHLDRRSWSSVVKLWDVASGQQVRQLDGHSGCVYALAFSPDGKILASADCGRIEGPTPPDGGNAAVRLWDVGTGELSMTAPTDRFAGSSLAFSPDGKLLAVAGGDWGDGEIRLWDLEEDKGPVTFARTTLLASAITFSPDGSLLASASNGGTVTLWRMPDRSELMSFQAHSFRLFSIAFAPDGKTLATSSWDRTVKLWNAATGGELATFKTEVPVHSVRFFADGNKLAAGCNDKRVILWHVDRGKEVLRMGSEQTPTD